MPQQPASRSTTVAFGILASSAFAGANIPIDFWWQWPCNKISAGPSFKGSGAPVSIRSSKYDSHSTARRAMTRARRWSSPAEPLCEPAIAEALAYGPRCPQLAADGTTFTGDEDCLTLNLWTTELRGARPVMVFIHGGGNIVGSAGESAADGILTYDGALLARTEGVVLVTIQYRLGGLGFFAHEALGPSGANWGLQDQVAALRWIQANIARFRVLPGKGRVDHAEDAGRTAHELERLRDALGGVLGEIESLMTEQLAEGAEAARKGGRSDAYGGGFRDGMLEALETAYALLHAELLISDGF